MSDDVDTQFRRRIQSGGESLDLIRRPQEQHPFQIEPRLDELAVQRADEAAKTGRQKDPEHRLPEKYHARVYPDPREIGGRRQYHQHEEDRP